MSSSRVQKPRIVILGGGISSLTTAYYLTEKTNWRDQFESITVYQLGWRLGGKGASGRNADRCDRIEEHGIHFFFGFYDNAFRLMRGTYDELNRPLNDPLSRAIDGPSPAFCPGHSTTLMEEINGSWSRWDIRFPSNHRVPGDSSTETPWESFLSLLKWMQEFTEQLITDQGLSIPSMDLNRDFRRRPRNTILDLLGDLEFDKIAHTPLELAWHLASRLPTDVQQLWFPPYQLLRGLLSDDTERLFEQIRIAGGASDTVRRALIVLRLALAIARGMLRDGVVRYGYDAVEKHEFTSWLRRHGARDRNVWWSAVVTNLYCAALAFDPKDGTPNLSAASALRALFRLFFHYKGAFVWKMQSGMGDVVFAPLYEVLQRRGVKFEFFHRVRELRLTSDQSQVGEIEMGVQATLKPTSAVYDPLVSVRGLPSWPAKPRFEFLNEGDRLRDQEIDLESAWSPWITQEQKKTLKLGDDYDIVVLGISIAALPHIAAPLIRRDKRWRQMVTQVKTIQTQAAQLWLNCGVRNLGWKPIGQEEPLVSGFIQPFDSWSDMTQTRERENWPSHANVENISYFINVLLDEEETPEPSEDPGYPESRRQRVSVNLTQFLTRHVSKLWPGSTVSPSSTEFDWNLLVDLDGNRDRQRLKYQFTRANINPSDRYVLSAANTARYRIKPDQSGFSNLILAGDWTDNGFNMGSAEAATISGMQAAKAISRRDLMISGASELSHPLPGWFRRTTEAAIGFLRGLIGF